MKVASEIMAKDEISRAQGAKGHAADATWTQLPKSISVIGKKERKEAMSFS
jgi:hypothetical protein